MLNLRVRLATTANESRVVAVSSCVHTDLCAIARQPVEKDEGSGSLCVLSALRVRWPMLRAQHIFATQLDHGSVRREVHCGHQEL